MSEGFFREGSIPKNWQRGLPCEADRPCPFSLKALEDDSKGEVRCALLFSVCAFQGHTVTGHMRCGQAHHRFHVARETRRTNWVFPRTRARTQ